jgi:hypothetical protein
MSLLLHIVAKFIFFAILGAVVLTLLTWLTQKTTSNRIALPGEWPEDKATYVDRVSIIRDYKEKERRRAS